MKQGLREAALGGKGYRTQVESFVLERRRLSAPSGSGAKERTKRLNHRKWERKEQVAPCSQGRSKRAPTSAKSICIFNNANYSIATQLIFPTIILNEKEHK